MRIVMTGLLALFLAGCGEPPGGEMGNETKIEGDVRQLAGLYRETITMGGADGEQYADDEMCLTEEDVKDGHRAMLLALQGDACEFERYELTGDTLDAVMLCKADATQPETRSTISGTVTTTGRNLQMSFAGFGNGEGAVEMHVASERIGDCPEDSE